MGNSPACVVRARVRRRGTWYFADGGCPALNPAVMMSVGGGLAVPGWAVKSRTTVWTFYYFGERGTRSGELMRCSSAGTKLGRCCLGLQRWPRGLITLLATTTVDNTRHTEALVHVME